MAQSRTKDEIIQVILSEHPYNPLWSKITPDVKKVMDVYAKQEALAYANWLSEKTITNENQEELWVEWLEYKDMFDLN